MEVLLDRQPEPLAERIVVRLHGDRLVNIVRFANRWRAFDEVEAVRLAALAREVKPYRTFAKPPELKPKPVKQMVVERPRVMQRRMPSLPTMPWQDDRR